MLLHCTRKNDFFQILSFIYEVFNSIFMSNAHYILFNNRSGIQLCRYIMTSCTNNFHPSLESCVIRLRPYKRRKEKNDEY